MSSRCLLLLVLASPAGVGIAQSVPAEPSAAATVAPQVIQGAADAPPPQAVLPSADTAKPGKKAAAPKGKAVIRSGEVVTCMLAQGCTEELVNGEHFYVLVGNGFTVKSSLNRETDTTYADVTIVNKRSWPQHLIPAEFRIDVSQPQYKRLSYIDPAKLGMKKGKATTKSKGLPPPSYFTSEKHQKEKEALAARFAVPPLPRKVMKPNETVTGRVYFEAPGKAATAMSLVLPIFGETFEFPYPPPSNLQ